MTRPAGVPGRTATIDVSEIKVTPGQRASNAELLLSLRSSRGGEHRIELPDGAMLQSVAIDGTAHPIRQDGREVTVPLVPGRQRVDLAWREQDGIGLVWQSPAVDIRMESVNASLIVDVPESRWILAVGGPPLGPAVLFWSYLAVLLAVAFGLGQVRLTPLRFRHWLLLGIGLTQASIAAAGIVVAWLLALGWRGSRDDAAEARFFHLGQIALVCLTGAALIALLLSIRTGLLGLPEMQIAGNGSHGYHLRWYQDRADALLPSAWIVSVPVIVYRIAMLAWALWLTQALLRWLRWGWDCFSRGEAWRPVRLGRKSEAAPSEPAQS